MVMMGMFKWLRKDVQRDRNGWNLTQKQCLNNESYRNALQAFIDRRRSSSDNVDFETPCSPDKARADLLVKNNNNKCDNEQNAHESKSYAPGVPHIPACEIFEVGWIPGTEDRYLELIFAEWQNTRVSLKRHSHPECKDAIKADLNVLSEIRHPNVLLLMASTFTDDYGIISIFESVDCTLYHYIHDQGEKIPIQGIAKCGGRLCDALRHCHMRGYVHTAINSHCVYLASNGIVKLGGWELAMHIDKPKPHREYEERLRTEIFRWQAPELFRSYEPHKESDVYGLTLLIWEMCTMRVPWSGFSKTDVERQYFHWKRGIITNLYDFPPALYSLLEAGLQLDINKRVLDMNRLRRFLQRLEMQFEDEGPIYLDEIVNNNNESGKTYILSKTKSAMNVMKSKSSKLSKSISAKQLSYSSISTDASTRQYYTRRSKPKQNANQKSTEHIEQINNFVDDVKNNTGDDLQKNINSLSINNLQNHYKKMNYPNINQEVASNTQYEESAEGNLQPWNYTYKKVKAPEQIVSRATSEYSSPLNGSTDDEECFKDARTNLQHLKKELANKREQFFQNNCVSYGSPNLSPSTSKIILDVRSKDYEPHKPASHKTSLEPKYNKSPSNQYDSSYLKSKLPQCRKVPYLDAPKSIKNAIIQPLVLNASPQNFFESSLWRKEKQICLSKMRKDCTDDSQTDDNSAVSAEAAARKEEEGSKESDSNHSNDTFIISKQSQKNQNESTRVNVSDSTSIQSEPIQDLRNALDRATKIVRSISPTPSTSCSSSPFRCFQNFDSKDEQIEQATSKSIFEQIYGLNDKDDEEIQTIERSRNNSFLFIKSDVEDTSSKQNELSNDISTSFTLDSLDKSICSETSYSRNFVCESIAEVSYEFNTSCNDASTSKKKGEFPKNKGIVTENEQKESDDVQTPKTNEEVAAQAESKERDQNPTSTNPYLLVPNDRLINKDCKSCRRSSSSLRRRSLPVALSQLRIPNDSSTLKKLPICRGDIPYNTTTEDLYIDDEFNGEPNINLILLGDDITTLDDDITTLDDDFFQQISDLYRAIEK